MIENEFKKKLILVIESNNNFQVIFNLIFKHEKLTFSIVDNGASGILFALQKKPSLIIVNRKLPDILCEKLILILKSASETNKIPIIVLSNPLENHRVRDLMKMGASDILLPTHLEYTTLLNTIHRYLAHPDFDGLSIEEYLDAEEKVVDVIEEIPEKSIEKVEGISAAGSKISLTKKKKKDLIPIKTQVLNEEEFIIKPLLSSESVEGIVQQIAQRNIFPTSFPLLIDFTASLNTDLDSLNRAIEKDRVMLDKVMELASSNYFNPSESEVEDINKAVTLIGYRGLKHVLIQICLFDQVHKVFNAEHSHRLIRHGLVSSVVAKKIAKLAKYNNPDLCFFLGLVHDIGVSLLKKDYPAEYKKILDLNTNNKIKIDLLENNFIGINHSDLAGQLLAIWGLSDKFIKPIKYHHLDYSEILKSDSEEKALMLILKLTEQMSIALGAGSFFEGCLEEISLEVFDILGFSSKNLLKEFLDIKELLYRTYEELLPDTNYEEMVNMGYNVSFDLPEGSRAALVSYNKDDYSLLELIFRRLKYNVKCFNSFSIETLKFKPDVVIINLLKNQDITDIKEQVKTFNKQYKKKLPVILISSRDFLVKYANLEDNFHLIGRPYALNDILNSLEEFNESLIKT